MQGTKDQVESLFLLGRYPEAVSLCQVELDNLYHALHGRTKPSSTLPSALGQRTSFACRARASPPALARALISLFLSRISKIYFLNLVLWICFILCCLDFS